MKIIGPLFVTIAAISYGLPATFMKLAFADQATPMATLFCMFLTGMVVLNIFQLFNHFFIKADKKLALKTMIIVAASGMTIGLSNISYFYSVQQTEVAISAVMLMQSVWIALLLSCWHYKIKPSKKQILSIILILFGTVLATDLIHHFKTISYLGMALGFLAGILYALTIHFTATLYPDTPAFQRAGLMSIGAFISVAIFALPSIDFAQLNLAYRWGGLIAIFSLILPLLFLSYGMPRTPQGMGAIITSLELPSAIIFASIILHESTDLLQWIGVIIIIIAVTFSQISRKKKTI